MAAADPVAAISAPAAQPTAHRVHARPAITASTTHRDSRRPLLRQPYQSARAVISEARVAYVDNDPPVLSHVRALLARDERIQAVEADLADAPAVLGHQAIKAVIDPAEPVCIVLGLVLSLMPAARPCAIVAGYARLVAPGSYVVISCARVDDEVMWKGLRAACTAAVPRNHTRRTVGGFLDGLELVPPGLVAAQGWQGGWRDASATPPGAA